MRLARVSNYVLAVPHVIGTYGNWRDALGQHLKEPGNIKNLSGVPLALSGLWSVG